MIGDRLQQLGYIRVPMRRTAVNHLELDAVVNGHEARFLVDTGASTTVIDRSAAERWQLRVTAGQGSACGVGVSGAAGVSRLRSLRLADLDLRDLEVAVLDLSHINGALEAKRASRIDGVLGADLMRDANAIIEIAAGNLHLQQIPSTGGLRSEESAGVER